MLAALSTTDLNARALLAIAAVTVAAQLLGRAAALVRQPRVNGEILAGILLGPSLLGLVAPEALSFLFPPEVVDPLAVLSQVGLVAFMFLVGLDLDLGHLRGHGHRAVVISHTSILVPMVLGSLLGVWLHPRMGGDVDRVGFVLFLGAAMSITAFPVLARILRETGLDRSRMGVVVITCAAVDDITAWCVLAVVVAVVGSSGSAGVLLTLGLSLAFLAVAFLVVRPLLARMGTVSLPTALGIAVFAAWATEAIGIHAIFGAFVAGVVMPRAGGFPRLLHDRLEPVTVGFLLPVFFAVVGLKTRVDLLDSAYLWGIAALVLVVAVAGKWGGSMLAARAVGEGWGDAATIGILMNTRGLTELVILTVGLELGVVTPALFTVMVLMALATTAMAMPLLALLGRSRSVPEASPRPMPDRRSDVRHFPQLARGAGSTAPPSAEVGDGGVSPAVDGRVRATGG
jgi:Kef-type K+ transport system membrane component KefB